MRHRARRRVVGLLLSALLLFGAGSLVTACNTVAGAGQDVSNVGHAVATGAERTQRATGVP
jgi:entericidin B